MPDLRIRTVEAFGDGIHEPDVLRINAVLTREEGEAVVAELEELFKGRLTLHAILAPNYGVYFLEAFDPGASKWSALELHRSRLGPGPRRHRRGRRRHQRPADDPPCRAGHRHAVGPARSSRRRRPDRRTRPRDRSRITPLIPTKQREIDAFCVVFLAFSRRIDCLGSTEPGTFDGSRGGVNGEAT